MDRAEEKTYAYLNKLGFTDIVFEPDGNIPPDFVCDKEIAIEVRRLNYLEEKTESRLRGCDETSIPLDQKMEKLVEKFGEWKERPNWWLTYEYERPLGDWRKIGPLIESKIRESISKQSSQEINIVISSDPLFEINLYHSSNEINDGSVGIAVSCDGDTGGLLFEKLKQSLVFCIKTKSEKISKYRWKYKKWWLVLVDNIIWRLKENDSEKICSIIGINNIFDKIIILCPEKIESMFEYENNKFKSN